MIDKTQNKLKEAIQLSRTRKDQSLIRCLIELRNIERQIASRGSKCEMFIYTDFTPYSFYFEHFVNDIFSGNGGIIFHGKHDGFGNGSAPTFSVTLSPTDGWCIHT